MKMGRALSSAARDFQDGDETAKRAAQGERDRIFLNAGGEDEDEAAPFDERRKT